MNYIDVVFLIILLISAGISFWRGFTRELFSLLGWMAASWVAIQFAPKAQDLGAHYIDSITLRVVIAFVVLFVVTLVLVSLVNHLINQFVDKHGLSPFNRLVGFGFGLLRGILIIVMVMLVGNFMEWPDQKTRQASFSYPYFVPIADWLRQRLPPDIGQKFAHYSISIKSQRSLSAPLVDTHDRPTGA